MSVRDLLLKYDYQDAVQLLMKLPSNLSVTYCTQFALHLKDPLRFSKPNGTAFSCGVSSSIKDRNKQDKLENKFEKLTVPIKTNVKNRTAKAKIPFEMVSQPTKYKTELDNGTGFMVLDIKDNSENKLPLNASKNIEESKPSAASTTSTRNREIKSNVKENGASEVSKIKLNLSTHLNTLESLLTKEVLSQKELITREINEMKSLLSKLPEVAEESIEAKNNRRGARRVASIAVDVSKYFEED